MTREEADFIGSMNMCDEISNEAYKKIMVHCDIIPPWKDCISRQAVKEAMYHEAFETDSDMQKWDSGCWIRYKMFENVIETLPCVEPKPRKGEWIKDGFGNVICSSCAGYRRDNRDNHIAYCNKCGAKMSEGSGEE